MYSICLNSTSKRASYLWGGIELILGIIALGAIYNVILTLMGRPDGDTPVTVAIIVAGFWSVLAYGADRKRRGTLKTPTAKQ